MSGTRGQVELFFRTLLLGDFEEEQSTSGQIVGGLISMIPVLDQVMDVRDVTGCLFQINRRGGFKQADSNQLVNLGFAAFGVIPEVGSAFKTVFKPLWKERHAAKGMVHGGIDAIEGLLGMGKGGGMRWIRQELLGKWAARTNMAIIQVEAALAAVIQLTEFIATASGWKDWLIPDPIQAMAKELLPSLRQMKAQIREPLERASREIEAFLEDLLGEQAAALAMGIGERAAAGSARAGSRPKTGNNKADLTPKGEPKPRQPQSTVKSSDRTSAKKGTGPAYAAVQRTRKAFKDLANQEKGLLGEHMVDYHELARLQGSWPHDERTGKWNPETVSKLNVDKRPVNLSLADLPKVNHPGIDAVWQHGGSYTATEAKARESIVAAYALGKFLVKKGKMPEVAGLNPDQQLLHYLLSDSSDKRGTQYAMVQMSVDWVEDRSRSEGLPAQALAALKKAKNRRVVLVTFESGGALDHAQALANLHIPGAEAHPHPDHGITRQWEAKDIDAVVKARERAYETKKPSKTGETSASTKGNKPAKATKSRKK